MSEQQVPGKRFGTMDVDKPSNLADDGKAQEDVALTGGGFAEKVNRGKP